MSIKITGKNLEASEAFQDYVKTKLKAVLEKFLNSKRGLTELASHVRVEKEHGRFATDCSVTLRTGLILEAHGEAQDAYGSADAALERLETRLRRYKRRLRNHHHAEAKLRQPDQMARDLVLAPGEDLSHDADEGEDARLDGLDEHATAATAQAHHPVVIAETERALHELPVSEAAMRLDVTEAKFLVFRNAANGGINIVYRRDDGHIGWIDPKSGR